MVCNKNIYLLTSCLSAYCQTIWHIKHPNHNKSFQVTVQQKMAWCFGCIYWTLRILCGLLDNRGKRKQRNSCHIYVAPRTIGNYKSLENKYCSSHETHPSYASLLSRERVTTRETLFPRDSWKELHFLIFKKKRHSGSFIINLADMFLTCKLFHI